MAVRISDKPWSSFSASDYPSAAAYADACLINLNTGPRSSWTKGACYLPVYEPEGALNRGGVHNAAGVLAGARGGLGSDVPADAKRAAARKLVQLYRQLDEQPPDAVMRLAMG